MSFKKRIMELYEDLENLLISEIDSSMNIQDNEAWEYYLMSVHPDEYALYCFIREMFSKKEESDDNA